MKNEKLTDTELKLNNAIKNALVKGKKEKIIVYVKRVSSSGFSRKLRFAFVDNGKVLYPNYLFSSLGIGTLTKDGSIRVIGCGSDIIFQTLYKFLQINKVKDANKFAKNYTFI